MNRRPYHIELIEKLSQNKVPLIFVKQIDYWIKNKKFKEINNIPDPKVKKFAELKLEWENFKSQNIISKDEIEELERLYL